MVHTTIIIWFFLLLSSSEAYTNNNNGNITIKWDFHHWTHDGYVAVVTINNYQKDRSIPSPGWTLGWTWAENEVIWGMLGAEATEKGDCSSYKPSNIPHSCDRNPRVVDLLPGARYCQQIASCCRGGVLEAGESASAFQLSVGNAGTTVETVMMPDKFVFLAPKQLYVCGTARNVTRTVYRLSDRRGSKANMTWKVTCIFYNETKMSSLMFWSYPNLA